MGNIEIKRVQWFSFRNHKDSGCVKTINLSCKSLFSSFKNYDRLLNFSELSRAYKLTTLNGRTFALLNSVQKFIEIQCWLLLTFFICLHNQLSSFYSIMVQMSEKRDSSNRQWKWMIASFSNFYGKISVGFCLNNRKLFFLEFSF